MNFIKVNWDYVSDPECENGEIVVLVQYGEAEIAKYITPKPKNAPTDGGNFIFEMCDNEDDLEEEVFKAIVNQYSEIMQETDKPFLFLCPVEFSERAIWNQ